MSELRGRNNSPELAELRSRLQERRGEHYWRSLDELAESPEFLDYLHREFPERASELTDPVSRRRFMQLMGASVALAGAAACSGRPPEKIIPYVRQPEELVPGEPLYYASAATLGGYATGVLVESHMGRPTKIEGNPDHPASLGKSDSLTQASILNLYDPDRSQVVLRNGRISTWESFLATVTTALSAMEAEGGGGLRILTGGVTSPTLIELIRRTTERLPGARWHRHEPVGPEGHRRGVRQAFGDDVDVTYRFDRASVVLSLDADFMQGGPGRVRYVKDFSDARRVRSDDTDMNRLYAVEG
ncbi:MAG: TAT-variant-translocated molybdopterin oxidoreductase, partial [Acidobacteriota bacterium]